ncbi:MAG: DUF4179 domain-containing protein [Chloroflexota bacterium]
MTTREEIETRLLRAVAVEPPEDGLRWLDQRVAQIAARPVALPRRGLSSPRLILHPVALLAAFVLLTGAVVGALGLLDWIIESSGQPGWQTAWDEAERLDLSATDAGVTINVERAYADLNQVLVGFTVAGLEVPTTAVEDPPALQWMVEIQDPTGRSSEQWATSQGGMGMDETGLSAVVQTWEGVVAPSAGTWVLTFTSVGYHGGGFVPGQCTVGATEPECVSPPPTGMIDGTWQFRFQLPEPIGAIVSTDAQATVGQGTLTLTELRVSPTMIKATMALQVAGAAILDWGWVGGGSVRQDGTAYSFHAGRHVTTDPEQQGPMGDVNELMTVAGTDAVAGTWELEFAELSYRMSNGERVQLDGPWTLTVTVP